MLTFAEHFRKGRTDTSIVNRWICAPVGVSFCLLAWSPWLVGGLNFWEAIFVRVTDLFMAPFATYMLGSFAFGIYVLYRAYRESNGLLRLQARYLLIAMAVPIAPALITNVVVPLTLGVSTHGKFGPLFSLIMVGLIAHAIIRHRFMDIRVVIRQGAVYLAAFLGAGTVLSAPLGEAQILSSQTDIGSPHSRFS